MADECSFCAERRSTAIIQNDAILAHTDCKEMDLCPIRAFFQRKAILSDKPAPKSNSPCLATSTVDCVCVRILRVVVVATSDLWWTRVPPRNGSVDLGQASSFIPWCSVALKIDTFCHAALPRNTQRSNASAIDCTRQKSRSFSLWVRYLKKIALIGHAE